MAIEETIERKLEFKLNKESSFELMPETEEEDGDGMATAVCCVGCNTGEGVTSGCPVDLVRIPGKSRRL